MYQNGYRQKLIQIITGYNQSYISKMVNSTRPYLPSIDNANEDQMTRKYVVDRILELRPIPTMGFSDQDKYYIKLLLYCLVDKERICKLYHTVSKYKLAQVFRSDKYKKEDFEPTLIDLTQDEYDAFLATANF